MTDRELLQQALDALESRCGTNADERKELLPAIRARLAQPELKNQCGETCERAKLCAICAQGVAQPEQEPVVCNCNQGQSCQVCDPPQPEHDLKDMRCECCGYLTYHREHMGCIRAANTPQRQPLTDDEIVDMWATLHYEDKEATVVELARAIEAAHNIKETK